MLLGHGFARAGGLNAGHVLESDVLMIGGRMLSSSATVWATAGGLSVGLPPLRWNNS